MEGDGGGFGVIYHTVKVGNNQEVIFRSDEDREMYLTLLKRYKKRLRFRLYAYVLMPDHVHLLLEPGPVVLPRIMHSLHSAYARYFNKIYRRSGHLFQGRYLSGPCTGMEHFWKLLRWIHFHPLRSGLVQTIEDFPWSSHGEYLSTGPEAVVDREVILLTLAPDITTGQQLYREIIATGMEENQPLVMAGWEEAAAAAGAAGQGDGRQNSPSILELATEVAGTTGTTLARICSGDRSETVVWSRSLISYIALRLGSWTAAEVARVLNKHPATIIRGAERVERKWNPQLGSLVRRVWQRLQGVC